MSAGTKATFFTAVLALAIVAPGAVAWGQASDGREAEARAQDPRIDILPLLAMRSPESAAEHGHYTGGYTRFSVTSDLYDEDETTTPSPRSRRYNAEDRGFVQRWLVGRSISRVVSIRVALSRPGISATTTLAAASHDSNRTRGESWSTEIHGQRMLTPYFRVDATTTATVEANLNASSSIQGDVTGTFIDVLTRAARLLAPSTTLVTSLTAPRIDAASDFIDQSISTLFARTLAEKTASEFLPNQWSDDLVEIRARFPRDESVSNDRETDDIGTWTVHIEPAIVSIFNTTPLCGPEDCSPVSVQAQARTAFEGLAPYTVLNFTLDGQQTLIQTIRGDEAVARALEGLTTATANKSGTANVPTAARVLCNVITGKAESLGFNRFDAAAIIWALTYSDAFPNAEKMVDKNVCISASLMEELGLDEQAAIATEAPAPDDGSETRSSSAPAAPAAGSDASSASGPNPVAEDANGGGRR